MQTRHPLRAALVATCAPLVMITLFGNSWFTEQVRLDDDRTLLARRWLATLAAFPWTFTPREGAGGGTIWVAQVLGILVVVGGTFLITWAVARHATGSSLFLGAWGTTVLVAMLGASVTRFVVYGLFFGDTDVDGLGRFWHSVYQGQEAALWGVGVGLLVGLFAAVTVGGVVRTPNYVMSSAISGDDGMGQPLQPASVIPEAPERSPWADETFIAEPVVTAPPAGAVVVEVPAPPRARQPLGTPSKVLVGEPPAGERPSVSWTPYGY